MVQNQLRYVEDNTKTVLGHNSINKLVISSRSDNRTRLSGDHLKVEIDRLERNIDIVGVVYCIREGTPGVYKIRMKMKY